MRCMSISSLSAGTVAVLSILGGNGNDSSPGSAPAPVVASTASRAPADAIDQVIAATMAADDLPSVALVVGRAGKILKQAAYGEASIELHVPATPQTVYPIASATKAITSTAIFLLLRAGKFSLEDSITELLPDLPPSWLEVTPRHLLTHTSGLPDIAVTPGREPLVAASREEALTKVRGMPLVFAAGTRWSYNQRVMVETRAGQRSVGHSGGGNAAFRYFIDEDMLIVMTTNGKTEEDALVDRIAAAARELQAK